MASAITAPTYDPTSTAQALAEKFVSLRQQILDAQRKEVDATEKGLTELNSAMTAFQNSLKALTSLNKTMFAQSATFSDTAIGTATASSAAVPGTYSFHVEQVATAGQSAYTFSAPVTGTFSINKGPGATPLFEIDAGAGMTVRELAAAINADPLNAGQATASVITTDNGEELLLTSKFTGRDNEISMSGGTGTIATQTQLVGAKDAIIYVGSSAGTRVTQASNTFTVVDGVKMTITKAHTAPTDTVTLTVAPDDSATTANVQAFVDAFNKLKATVNKLTDPGDPSKGVAGGPFAHDSGMRALNDRLNGLLRPTDATSLAAYGILSTRQGTLELRQPRLLKQLAADPTGLDRLIGSASATPQTGIAGALDKYLKTWNAVNGQIKDRQAANDNLRNTLDGRQTTLDKEYDAAYLRYVRQFTQLQSIQGIMNHNVTLFDALFSNSKD